MSEERLKEIKQDIEVMDTYGGYKDRYLELYNEVVRLRKIINKTVEYINKHCVNERISNEVGYKCYTMADTNELEKIINILKESSNDN